MKKYIVLICGVVLVIYLWLLMHRKTEQAVHSDSQPTTVVAVNQSSTAQPPPALPAQAPVASVPSAIAASKSVTNATASVINPALEAVLQKPIDFYGKVIDEHTNPVAGANISFRWDDYTAEDWTRTSTTISDADGLFSLIGKHGSTLIVSVDKDGYYTPHSGQRSFQFASGNPNFSSDSQNPIVFNLRKKGEGVQLITTVFPAGIGQIAQLHHDGSPVELDLLRGAQVPAGTGQLQLQLWRDVSDRKAKVFDWKLQLFAPGGGLVGTDEEFAFQAPQNGYQPSIVIDMPATNQNWQSEVRTKYYIQLQNGDYGRIDFYLLPYNGVFTVHSAINPTGSQNLEPAQ